MQHINFSKKIFILCFIITDRSEKGNIVDEDFEMRMNSYINKITKSINNFNLIVVVANVYEIYNLFYDYLNKDISGNILK
jgi:hypothetical protein